MNEPFWLWWLVIGASTALLGLTSAIDAALSAIGRHRLNALQDEGGSRAARINQFLATPGRLKAAILLVNTACVIAVTAAVMVLSAGWGAGWRVAGLIVLLIVLLIVGEAIPKGLALRDTAAAARLLTGPMALLVEAIWPLARLIGFAGRPLVRLVGGRDSEMPLVTEEEVLQLVNAGEEEGLIEPGERQMIEGIFSFGETAVREVMTPRVDIVALDEAATLDEALDLVIARGHSRVPVYRDTIEHVVGILYAKDLLPWLRAERTNVSLGSLVRAAHFIPETMKVDALLRDLQTRKVHLAIVVDEYGGTAGLVTIEDILEQIVGEIQDEYDRGAPEIQLVGAGEFIIDARVLIDDVNALLGVRLTSDESDRIGGLVFETLGRVPRAGDVAELTPGLVITVLAVEGLRPRTLRIKRVATPDQAEPSGGVPRDGASADR